MARTLGPHVVGQRVVVRRLVPGETGPTGGPAFADLLGVCLSWDAGVCVVQPDDGAAVSIPVELIVSGKPVPPRPSVRGRVSVEEAERRAAATGWPAAEDGEEFRIASVARVRRALPTAGVPVELSATGDRASASVGTGCDPVAEAQAALAGDWMGLRGLFVEPSRRRGGLATAVLGELLDWGAERGALTVWARVAPDADAARSLLDRLGFDVHHLRGQDTNPSDFSQS